MALFRIVEITVSCELVISCYIFSVKLHRFIGDFNLSRKEIIISDESLISQIKQVLRLRVGEKLVLSDGLGSDALCVLEDLPPRSARLSVLEIYPSAAEPEIKVSLYLAVLKKENFELAAQKAVECGVFEIIPVISSRTVKLGLNIDRLRKIIKEAAEQSGRGFVPELKEPVSLEETLRSASGKIVFFHPSGKSFREIGEAEEKVSVFVGPEGGWTDEEIKLATESGAIAVSLGSRILRAETAAAVGVFILSSR